MKGRRGVLLLLVGAMSGCDSAADQTAVAPVCRAAQSPVELPPELHEASGVAVSRSLPGVLWSHNDSGNEPLLVAFDPTGALVTLLDLSGVGGANRDWEDLALGPCPEGDCLYIGDIGDNQRAREEIVVHRLPEPAAGSPGPRRLEEFRARFPDGAKDAEGLFILPPDRLFIVTKGSDSPIGVYAFPSPLRADEAVELRLVRTLSEGPVPLGDQVTGAAASRDGQWVAVRTYTSLLLYRADELLDQESEPSIRADLRGLGEPQGEGVAFGETGSIALVSEGGTAGMPGSLSVVWCADLASSEDTPP